jgi:sugar lactone lactonase YvrE
MISAAMNIRCRRCPTMRGFGGDDLETLYVTTVRLGRPATEVDALSLLGNLFAMHAPAPGLVEMRRSLRVTY